MQEHTNDQTTETTGRGYNRHATDPRAPRLAPPLTSTLRFQATTTTQSPE